MKNDQSTPSGVAVVGTWKQWAIGLGVANIGLLAGIVILIAVTRADVLASTALVVAILAFLIQIVIFLAQFWMSAEQSRITSVTASTTEARIKQVIDRLEYRKTHEGESAAPQHRGRRRQPPAGDATPSTSRLDGQSTIDSILGLGLDADTTLQLVGAAPPLATDTPQTRYLLTAPATVKELLEALDDLAKLHPWSVSQLIVMGQDEVVSQRMGVPAGLAIDDAIPAPGGDDLVKNDFAQETSLEGISGAVVVLTDRGRRAVRVFLANGSVPDEWLPSIAKSYEPK